MSHFVDRLRFFVTERPVFSDGHGAVTDEDRKWEEAYRQRWQHDKVVRSTHGVNCTGSCSWKIYVKGGIVTWETQQTDYPRTRPDMPNHEPRGCSRGASYSWYLYSANRLKYPMVRSALVKLWRERRAIMDPVQAWQSIVEDDTARRSYQSRRGLGGFVRSTWDEVNEIVAAANVYTIRKYGPDRVVGFSPIPAMSMVSYAAGSRYLSLIGGVCLSFYDWYCDLPPASPQTWGEQTDVPESADWYNSTFIMLWGSNVPQTRTPDAHFMVEARYKGTKIVSVFPDYAEGAKFGDIWLHPKQGTDAALALAMGHVILKEFHLAGKSDYFMDYCRRFTDMPCLVRLVRRGDQYVPDRLVRASDFEGAMGEANNPDWKTVMIDELSGKVVTPVGSVGFRWGQKDGEDKGKWNLKSEASSGAVIVPQLSLAKAYDEVVDVLFPYFGNREHPHFNHTGHPSELSRALGARRLQTCDGEMLAVTVYDLFVANYGLDQGLGGRDIAQSYDDDLPYTPAWQEAITGVNRADVISVARQFAENAHKTQGKSMVIIGAGINHWFHMDMAYRAIINMLIMCGCVGKSGGGWSHYVGQEKLRPQTGWTALAFALDWHRPPRHMNATSFFYAHTDQWRYDPMDPTTLLSSLADKSRFHGTPIDYNVRAERMGWLPSAPQLAANPLDVGRSLASTGEAPSVVARELASGALHMACEDPDNPVNFPRNMFVWRSNLLGSSGKGHEYFLKHLLGAVHGVQGEEVAKSGGKRPEEIAWHDNAPQGKLDLLVTLDFRMSTTCMYSDVVLSYNAGYTNVHELIPWRTISGRQQLYQDHAWLRAFGESLCVYKPPIDTGSYEAMVGKRSNGNPELVLNFITPHQKWGIHSTYTDNLLMLTLSRGGPIVWMAEADAKQIDIADNDWIECYNANGALCARAVVSQRVPRGMVMMYHAQEKIVNTPGSEITGTRGGIHNSVTRIAIKPTHMIGGYAQLSYGFNYYGTVGSNRDEFLIVRKMKRIDWLDDTSPASLPAGARS
jgi:nitrate reductase alpha subunit